MAEDNEQKKDFTRLDPDQINLNMNGEPAQSQLESDAFSQLGRWPDKASANGANAKLPEAAPDNTRPALPKP